VELLLPALLQAASLLLLLRVRIKVMPLHLVQTTSFIAKILRQAMAQFLRQMVR
jgi:hypothetical protein